ncbi:Protein FAR1-RELATED SEQUENCE 5 [Abeliophyllum distichum]|uniref:Protein FAR1-RELATED SEQUENCE 5 n=1 Tax=Abeliophyllum distichum TaxID=126358 RepID=A0ABD1VQW4_9LAMI
MGDGWIVSTFVEEHNHPLATPSRQVRLLEIDARGPSSLGCVEKDIRNCQRDVSHDAETLIEHFTFEKEKNQNFVFDYETDDKNKFVRCFWADCESRRSYAYFGDVVVFDTTYNTNRYSMVFGPFVGGNHHGQTVILGCGLLSDETTESFVWLFTKFIEAMPNHAAPGVIITDQDATIARAISIVLPSTLHRFYARSTFLLSEFQNLRIRVKDIDTGGDVCMNRNRNKSVEETQVICDPNPVRAKGCRKRLKSRKEKAFSQSNRQCRACGTSGQDRKTCPTLQNR